MERDIEQPNNGNQPDPNMTPTSIEGNIENIEHSEHFTNTGASNRENNYQPPIIVNVPEQINGTDRTANKIAKEANKAAWASVWVNGFLLGITLFVACISMWQGCLTRQSVSLADSVFQATKRYNDSSLNIQRNAYQKSVKDGEAQDVKDVKTYALQKTITNAQIQAFKETQKEFKMQNTTYLQVKLDTFQDFYKINKLVVIYKIQNIGRASVQNIRSKSAHVLAPPNFADSIDYFIRNLKKVPFMRDNIYVLNGQETPPRTVESIFYEENIKLYHKHILFFYEVGQIDFINLLTKKQMSYYYIFSIRPDEQNFGIFNLLYNKTF